MYVPDVNLGLDKTFGVTAHTGDVADNHDVHSLIVTDLSPSTVDRDQAKEDWLMYLREQQLKPVCK